MEDGEMGQNRVQDVCQKFQVLEDQTVAHVLQEQEIQQHLSANKLKSQGVRHNLELARKLQEQEDERSRQLRWKLHKYIQNLESDYPQTIQEEQQQKETGHHRRLLHTEGRLSAATGAGVLEVSSSRSRRLERRERGRRSEDAEDRKESTTGTSDDGSLDHWDHPMRREFPRHGRPRSRQPLVWSELEAIAGWSEGDGCPDGGWERGAGERGHDVSHRDQEQLGSGPFPGRTLGHVGGVFQTLSEDVPGSRPMPHPKRTDGLQAAERAREGAGRKREHHSERVGEGSDSSRILPISRPRAGPDHTGRGASDSESHSRRRKHNRIPGEIRSRARSADGRPARCGRSPEPLRHHAPGRGGTRTSAPPRDRLGHLVTGPGANHLDPPRDPTEREGSRQEANGHQPLAARDRKRQSRHPLVADDQQTRQPLAVSQKHAPQPLVTGESPTHYPPRTKVKAKQVHFLLDADERVKPVHCLEASKPKPVQRPVDLKRMDAHWLIASKQKQLQPPLAVGEKGKHAQIPLAVKERKRPLHSTLANRNHLQYRLGTKEADAIIDYVLDKREGKDLGSPKQLSQSPPAFRGNPSPETDQGDPVRVSPNNRQTLPSPLVGDSREDPRAPAGLGAQRDPARNSSGGRCQVTPRPHPAGTHRREGPSPRLAPHWQESPSVRDRVDRARGRPARNRGNHSPAGPRANRQENGLHPGGARM
ncbi:serine/arginine repetitive matrix protein 1-like isoform X2 [Hemiscyllium ocellatum]|uniref:serine/arginine repetitive matrix protein 1-like isoform X2 n=1 Tax=Hemiscyllium ocellatum TaxID=170820 RepID=UPI00296659A5|nr:serine/arginine repetitive matrix protein 1-like isoform X2 [Hemiscyllium ocellatum]